MTGGFIFGDSFFVSEYWGLRALIHSDHSILGKVPDKGGCCSGNAVPFLFGIEFDFDALGLGNSFICELGFCQEPRSRFQLLNSGRRKSVLPD